MAKPRGDAALRDAVKDILVPYYRVSTREQADSGAGLAAQETAVNRWAEYTTGKTLLPPCVDQGYSGKSLNRPGMLEALRLVEERQAGGIVVAKLDRLSRSLLDFASLMHEAREGKWNIVAIDLQMDLSTPQGTMMANVLATFAQFERDVISQRTRDALAEKRAQGVRIGRPSGLDGDTLAYVLEAYSDLGGYAAVARLLNEEGVPTAQGAPQWHRAAVRSVVLSQDAHKLRQAA